MSFDNNHYTSNQIFDSTTMLIQSKNGYRFSADSLILSWYVHTCSHIKNSYKKALEIGSGNGVVSVVLKKRGFIPHITCIEIQHSLYILSTTNIENNSLSDHIIPIHGDFLYYNFDHESFDIIFTNPPYFGICDGKINPNSEKAVARHEFHGTIDNFMYRSSRLLKKKGLFFIIYPVKKLQFALHSAYTNRLFCSDILFIKETNESAPSLFCARFIKGNGDTAPLSSNTITMKDSFNNYTQTGKEIMYDLS